MPVEHNAHRLIRSAAIVSGSVVVIVGVYAMTGAGSTQPPDVPTVGTYRDQSSIFDAIASETYDSSLITADPNGSAFEIAKCIIGKITGGSCP